MKKYILKETGEELVEGKTYSFGIPTAYGFIPLYHVRACEEGMIEEVKEGGTHIDINYYLEHLAKRIHWNVENLRKYFGNLYTIYPAAVFSILLREVAIVLDDKYKNHIENSKEIYVISSLSGEITKVKDLNKVKNFKNFAAFRTLEDCMQAKEILKPIMKGLFKRK